MDASVKKQKIIVVCGPTATGKSALALAIARACGGELVNADSMQVYGGLVVGTAALTARQAGGIPVHLSGFLAPDTAYSVADWAADARRKIGELSARAALPVVCGGTGLYISSLVSGVDYGSEQVDLQLRERLTAEWDRDGAQAMLRRLEGLDPQRAERLGANDQKRILRALEQSMTTGLTAAQREAASLPGERPYDALLLGVGYSDRALLYDAINRRVEAMMKEGLLKEARAVWDNRARYKTAVQAIGYKEFFPYFEGALPLEACVERLKQATRNYAKRQLTWFGRMEAIHWLQADDPRLRAKALALTADFCHNI